MGLGVGRGAVWGPGPLSIIHIVVPQCLDSQQRPGVQGVITLEEAAPGSPKPTARWPRRLRHSAPSLLLLEATDGQGAQREGPESKPLPLVRLAQRLSLTAWMLITPRGRHKGGPDTPPTLSLSSLTPHLHCGLGAWHCSRACLPLASEWCPEWCPPGSAVPAPSMVAFKCFNWDQ